MKILIHVCPQRMWYVSEFLVPELKKQGVEEIKIWNDVEKKGNLRACMESFAARIGDGGTWHIQDDILIARDFVERCREFDEGVVYGFCCRNFGDRPEAAGDVYVADAWHSFQCVRIPDAYARECAEWVLSEAWKEESANAELPILWKLGKGDDTFFHEFLENRHGYETAVNLRPNLVEHVDYLIGGSALQHWRNWKEACADFFDDQDLVEDLKNAIKRRALI